MRLWPFFRYWASVSEVRETSRLVASLVDVLAMSGLHKSWPRPVTGDDHTPTKGTRDSRWFTCPGNGGSSPINTAAQVLPHVRQGLAVELITHSRVATVITAWRTYSVHRVSPAPSDAVLGSIHLSSGSIRVRFPLPLGARPIAHSGHGFGTNHVREKTPMPQDDRGQAREP
jgi:hypothetical protein